MNMLESLTFDGPRGFISRIDTWYSRYALGLSDNFIYGDMYLIVDMTNKKNIYWQIRY